MREKMSHGFDFANAKSENGLVYKEQSGNILKAYYEVHNELGSGI